MTHRYSLFLFFCFLGDGFCCFASNVFVSQGCSSKEKWIVQGEVLGQSWSPATSEKGAFSNILLAFKSIQRFKNNKLNDHTTKKSKKSGKTKKIKKDYASEKFFIYYVLGQAYWQLKMYDAAKKNFEKAARYSGKEFKMVDSTWGCLNAIHYQSPFLKVDIALWPLLLSALKDYKSKKWNFSNMLLSLVNMRFMFPEEKSENFSKSLSFLEKEKKQYFYILKSMTLLENEDTFQQGVAVLEKALASPLPAEFSRYYKKFKLLLAMTQYNKKKYQKSYNVASSIEKDAVHINSILSIMGWSSLQLKDYSAALSAASNMLYSISSDSFAPEAYEIKIITFFETCHYASVKKYLEIFKEKYDKTKRILTKWQQQKHNNVSTERFYTLFKGGFKKQDASYLPKEIYSEWIRSEKVLDAQSRLNDFLDQKNSYTKLLVYLKSHYKESSSVFNIVKNKLYPFVKKSQEDVLLEEMQKSIEEVNDSMLYRLNASESNLKNLELDLLKLTQQLLIGSEINSNTHDATTKLSTLRYPKKQKFVWSIIDPDSFETTKEEVWDDEKWSLQVQIGNICKTKGN